MKLISQKKIAVLYLLILFFNATVSAGTTDPLNTSELGLAKLLAAPAGNDGPASLRQQRHPSIEESSAADDAASVNELPHELLLVERKPADKERPQQRLADVYHYDYNRNETIHTVVDLQTQTVLSTERQQYLQLPLNEAELQRASAIIFADPEQMVLLQQEYRRITGRNLSAAKQLNIKAFAFTADTLPESLNVASKQCGLHRCAQVLLYTHDALVFEVSPIVNLSVGIVTQNIGY